MMRGVKRTVGTQGRESKTRAERVRQGQRERDRQTDRDSNTRRSGLGFSPSRVN
jgi:hypothetical protein